MQPTPTEDATEIAYEQYGDGRSLVLLHGGMAPRTYWNPVLPHLESYAVIVPQRPGFGTCLDDPAETSADDVLEREVACVRALLDEVNGRPVLFGHSYGAFTAIEAASEASVEAVVAYEPAVLPDGYRE